MHVLLAVILSLQDDPVAKMQEALAKRLKAYEKFTAGALADGLRVVLEGGFALEDRKDAANAIAVYDGGIETLAKTILAMESKPPELRKALGYLDKARKRAAAAEGDDRKCAALRYGLHRAFLVYQMEVSQVTELFNLGFQLVREGAYAEAEEALKEVDDRATSLANADPRASPQAIRWVPLLMSRVHLARGQYKEAAAALRTGLERAPEWGEQGMDAAKLHNAEEAVRIARALDDHLKKKADDADALLMRAHDTFFSADPKKSKPVLEALLKRNPEDKAAKWFVERFPED